MNVIARRIWHWLPGQRTKGLGWNINRLEVVMGRSIPQYAVFNMNTGNKFAEAVAFGDDKIALLNMYRGKAYQVMSIKSLAEREEW
jgi:hypothetical protein